MDRKTYIDTVLSTLRRVTGDEKLAIRAEIDGHIEDHMEGLIELGYDPALAEERALAAMGDPKEVGRELNRQYTGWGWVLLSRAAVLLTAVLSFQALLGHQYPGESLGQCRPEQRLWAEEVSSAVKRTAGYPAPVGSGCGAGSLRSVPLTGRAHRRQGCFSEPTTACPAAWYLTNCCPACGSRTSGVRCWSGCCWAAKAGGKLVTALTISCVMCRWSRPIRSSPCAMTTPGEDNFPVKLPLPEVTP